MYRNQAVRAAIVALLAVLLGAGSASAATDHVVITGGVVVPAGQTAGDVVVLDGTVRIAGHVTGDVVSVAGPVRVSGRVDGDLIAVSDRAFLGSTARVGGDLRYGDETPVLARGARVDGKISNEDWADSANGWGWVSALAWWLAVSVSTLIVGVLLVWLAPGALYAAERAVRERLGATIGVGRCDRDRVAGARGPGARHARGHTVRGRALVGGDSRACRRLRDCRVDCGATRAAQPLGVALGGALCRLGDPAPAALIPIAGELVGLAATVVGLGALAVALWRARRASGPIAEPRTPAPGPPAPDRLRNTAIPRFAHGAGLAAT